MLGDLDLIHMARDHCAPPAEMPTSEASSLRRMSLDSTLSATSSNASAALSSSWAPGSPKIGAFLMRQSSLPASAVSAPVNIPGRGARSSLDFPGAGAGAGAVRRASMTVTGPMPFAAAAAAAAAAGAPGQGASPPGAAHDAAGRPRLPMLVRSLSRGLSQSLDFR